MDIWDIDTQERRERQAVIVEALAWMGTPYHLNAKVKGAGVDCGTFLIAAFHGAGLIPAVDLGIFRHDFHRHRSAEVYLEWIEKYCVRVERDPLPADIVMYRYGRIVSHGAIVIRWPEIIHATLPAARVHRDTGHHPDLARRQAGIYSFWR